MQRDPRTYSEAARMLWNLPSERLAELASGRADVPQSVRDSAQMARGVKTEFLSPGEYGSEEAAIERLAGNLSLLPDFSLQEIAIATGVGPIRRPPRRTVAVGTPPTRRRTVRVLLIASVLLLGLEALARAGIGVPSPIGVIVDELGGGPAETGTIRDRVDPNTAPAAASSHRPPPLPPEPGPARAAQGSRTTTAKHENHALGRARHFAQGRDDRRARGKALALGHDLGKGHEADTPRGGPRKMNMTPERAPAPVQPAGGRGSRSGRDLR